MTEGAAVTERAKMLRESGRARQALALLGPHLSASPDDLEALRLAGLCHLQLGQVDRALTCAQRLIALAPNHFVAHLLMAVVQGRRRDVGAATQAVETAIRLAPDEPETYRIAASLDLQADRVTPRTEELARRAVLLAPHDPDTHCVLGSTLIELRRYDEAAAALGQAAALSPDDPAVATQLARLDIARGRSSSAAAELAAVARARPADATARQNMQVAAWSALRMTHLVLGPSVVVLGLLGLLDPETLGSRARGVAPICLLAILAAWIFQLRKRPSGFRVLIRIARSERMVGITMAAQAVCLLLLLATARVPVRWTGAVLGCAALFLVISMIPAWMRLGQIHRESQRPG